MTTTNWAAAAGDSRVRLAVVGAGDIGRRHMKAILNSAECLLCGVADPAPNGTAAADQFQVANFVDASAMIAAVAPEAIIVATPNASHFDVASCCLDHGVPVLIEKPVADTVKAGYALADLSDACGVPVLVGHHRRHNPLIQRARALIAGGAIGDVVAVSATWLARKPDRYFDVRWRQEPGGGPILINLIHDIDNLRHLIGEIVTVQSVTSNARRGFGVEDTAAILVTFATGSLGTIILSDSTPSPWSWELTAGEATSYAYHRVPADCYQIAGALGSLGVPSLRLWRHDGIQSWQSPVVEERIVVIEEDPMAAQLRHFVDVVRGKVAPLVSARDAARTLQVALAVSEAARTQSIVRLPDVWHHHAATPVSASGAFPTAS